MAKIHRFEIGRARRGGVYCPPLDLNFPALHRVVQNVSQEQLDEIGLTDEQPVESYVHYTIRRRSALPRFDRIDSCARNHRRRSAVSRHTLASERGTGS